MSASNLDKRLSEFMPSVFLVGSEFLKSECSDAEANFNRRDKYHQSVAFFVSTLISLACMFVAEIISKIITDALKSINGISILDLVLLLARVLFLLVLFIVLVVQVVKITQLFKYRKVESGLYDNISRKIPENCSYTAILIIADCSGGAGKERFLLGNYGEEQYGLFLPFVQMDRRKTLNKQKCIIAS